MRKESFTRYVASFNHRGFLQRSRLSLVRFSSKEQTMFAKRLSFLITAGVPLLESLQLIRSQTKSKSKGIIFDAIIDDVSCGQYISTGLAKFPNHFGAFTINLIRIGELSGILSENLMYLAEELAKKHALQRKVRSALVYPLFISMTTLGVTGVLTVFIFPKIMPVFLSLDITLPLTTRVLLSVSTFLQLWGIYVIAGLCASVILFVFVQSRVYTVHKATDWLLLRLPIAGDIARAYNVSNFCRTFGLLLHSGVRVTEALSITASVTSNLVYKEVYQKIAHEVTKGDAIAKHIPVSSYLFPDLLSHMIAVGEKSGSLTQTLSYLASLYETEVDEQTKNLSNTVEPVLLLVMGLLVGLIAVSVITPIYEITKNLQR